MGSITIRSGGWAGEGKLYVGRPTVLGNPFSVDDYGRERSIAMYERWLRAKLQDPRSWQSLVVAEMTRYAVSNDLVLVCWCAPLPCHADVIKRVLEERLAQ